MKQSYLYLLFFCMLIFNSCRKEDDISPLQNQVISGDLIKASFTGVVKDLQGNLLQGVQVSVGGQFAMSNASGIYLLTDVYVNKDRSVLQASKTGFWVQQKAIIAEENALNFADIVLFDDNKSYSVNSTNGGTVYLPGGTTILFPPDAFANSDGTIYSGTVTISAHEIYTSDITYHERVPGGDFLAVDSLGNRVLLLSYGMAAAKLYDNSGNELKLANGKKALLTIPINSDHLTIAPPLIKLWHYDESDMIWKEEGTGSRAGNRYISEVSHFSWWNCDDFSEPAYLKIGIYHCGPVAGAVIELTAPVYGTASAVTGSNGTVNDIVPSGLPLTLQVFLGNGAADTTIVIGPFASGSQNNFVVVFPADSCNTITGRLTDCNGEIVNGTARLYFQNQLIDSYTTASGMYTFFDLEPGTYDVCGTSQMMTSSAIVTVQNTTNQNISQNLQLCDTAGIYGTLRDCNGNIVNGTVQIYAGGIMMGTSYSTSGFYWFGNLSGGNYNVLANTGLLTGNVQVNYAAGCISNSRVDMQLCDSVAPGTSHFELYFTSSTTGVQNYSLNVITTKFITTGNSKQIEFTYLDAAAIDTGVILIRVPDFLAGTYPWNSNDSYINGEFQYQNTGVLINSVLGGQTFLTTSPPIGSPVQGSFSGPATMTFNGVPIPGSMSGSFNALRTH